jgi:hypothetical protein
VFVPKKNELPPTIAFTERRNPMPWGVVASPTDESQLFYSNIFAASFQNAESNPLPLKDSNVFFIGFVRYETYLHESYRMGFCFVYDVLGERWVLMGNENYNYCTKEDDVADWVWQMARRAETVNPIPEHLRRADPYEKEALHNRAF